MGTVTGYTADRMKRIEDSTVVSGTVVGDNLILTKRDASTINAGSVRGPVGPQGIGNTGGVTVCSSTTRPAAPTKGMHIYETDTGKTLVYQSSTSGWTPPWNQPWGELAYTVMADNQQIFGGTNEIDLISLSTSWTALANRKYSTNLYISTGLINSVPPSTFYKIAKADNTILGLIHETNNSSTIKLSLREVGLAAGPVTRKAIIIQERGVILVLGNNPANNLAISSSISVEDIGPNGAPV